MNISLEKIAPPVAFVIIGVIMFILGAADVIPIGNPPLTLSPPILKWLLVGLGILLIGAGPAFLWRENTIARDEQTPVGSQSSSRPKGRSGSSIVICANDDTNVDHLCKDIEANAFVKAKMIQYSGDMVRRIIAKLLERDAKVELLLQHPSKALNSYQLDKMALFHQRAGVDFKNRQNLAIRYYSEPASVRAVKLDDNVLLIGWYTYRVRSNTDDLPWLYGHNNAAVRVQPNRVDTHDLAATFDDVFQALWGNAVSNIDIEAEIDRARKALPAKRTS